MKLILIILFTSLPLTFWGQNVIFSKEILNSKDSSIIAVRDLWKSYILTPFSGQNKTSISSWNKDETDQGYSDIIKTAFQLPYYNGDITVYDIKKAGNDYYRIRNIWTIGDNINKSYLAIFSIYSKRNSSGFQLYNNFYVVKPNLKCYKTKNIDYYYPHTYVFNIQKAKEMEEFYSEISSLYENKDKQKVTYIIGNNLDEANAIIGFDYSVWSSSLPNAAYNISGQKLIVASREDHKHEIIHSIFLRKFTKSNYLFQEGIATYYGGSAGKNYVDLVNHLKEIVIKNPKINLANFADLDKVQDDGINNFYIIGAVLIDYAFETGGTSKVIKLFQPTAPNMDGYNEALSVIKSKLGIEEKKLDAFLKKYLQNFDNK